MVEFQHDSTCIVCLDQMKQAKVLPCKHYFHAECLTNWLQEFNSCPMCKASVNLSDESKQEDKDQNNIKIKIDSKRGKPRTDKLKLDIRRLEKYKKQQQKAGHLQRRRSSSIKQECFLDPIQPPNQRNQQNSLNLGKNQPIINQVSEPISPIHRRNANIQEINPQANFEERTTNFVQNQINLSPVNKRRKQQSAFSYSSIFGNQPKRAKPHKTLIQNEASRRVNQRKQAHKKEKHDFLNSDINVGSVVYSVPRPAITRRTVESEINRKMIEIVNAKFTVLYKRPPASGVPSDILQTLRKRNSNE